MTPRRAFLVAIAILLFLVVVVALGPGQAMWFLYNPPQQDLPLPESLIALDSETGQQLLSSGMGADAELLQASFQTQQYGSFCGVASSVVALNAMGFSLTQDDFFTPAAEAVREKNAVMFGGMNLDTLGGLLSAHEVQVQVFHAADTDLDTFRALASDSFSRPEDVVLVNYHRPTLEQDGGGHISPLAAYAPEEDRFLILDTASYKYPPVWVEAEVLWASMNTVDSDGELTRGFVLISR